LSRGSSSCLSEIALPAPATHCFGVKSHCFFTLQHYIGAKRRCFCMNPHCFVTETLCSVTMQTSSGSRKPCFFPGTRCSIPETLASGAESSRSEPDQPASEMDTPVPGSRQPVPISQVSCIFDPDSRSNSTDSQPETFRKRGHFAAAGSDE